jgi:hypothetical protein
VTGSPELPRRRHRPPPRALGSVRGGCGCGAVRREVGGYVVARPWRSTLRTGSDSHEQLLTESRSGVPSRG